VNHNKVILLVFNYLNALCIYNRDPFVMPISDQQRQMQNKVKLRFSNGVPSDQLVILNALCAYESSRQRGEGVAYRYCDDNFMSRSTMGFVCELHRQVGRCLESVTGIGNHSQAYARRHNDNVALKCALIGIGLSSNVAVRKLGTTAFLTEKGCKAKVHPSSINKKQGSVSAFPEACVKSVEIIGYQELVAAVGASAVPGAPSLLMLSTTPLSVFTFLLACGQIEVTAVPPDEDADEEENVGKPVEMVNLLADKWLLLCTSRSTADLILGARECLYDALVCYLHRRGEELPVHVAAGVEGIVAAITSEHFGKKDGPGFSLPRGQGQVGQGLGYGHHGGGGSGGSRGRGMGAGRDAAAGQRGSAPQQQQQQGGGREGGGPASGGGNSRSGYGNGGKKKKK
jgi:hypothetical protein